MAVAGSSSRGLKLIKAVEKYANIERFDSINIFRKIKLTSVNDGNLKAVFSVTPDMCNIGDVLHGGYSACVADTAIQYAYIGHRFGNTAWTTNMNILFLGKADLGDQVEVDCVPIKLTEKNAIIECTMTNKSSGEVMIKATANLLSSPKLYTERAGRFLDFEFDQKNV